MAGETLSATPFSLPRHPVARLRPEVAATLDRDGCVMLYKLIPADWLGPLRDIFDAGFLPSDQWPVPRGMEFRHAMVDENPIVQKACRLPALLGVVGYMMAEPFFLSQVEGREPRHGLGHQPLHRDGGNDHHRVVSALVFLDPYSPENGATRILRGTHKGEPEDPRDGEARAQVLRGNAGDVLVFDAQTLHGGTRNLSGEPRRSLLIGYAAEPTLAAHETNRALRGVRMAVNEIFEPAISPPATI